MSASDVDSEVTSDEAQNAFVSGGERLKELLADPDLAEAVSARREELRQADRQYAIGLATVRQAADLTQAELAQVMGVGQAAVAKIEHRHDLLLSTLRAYLAAAGGKASLVVEFDGGARRVEFDLDALGR